MSGAASVPASVPAVRLAAFGYHEVTEEPLTSGFLRPGAVRFTLTPRAFAAHLDRIAERATAPALVTTLDFERPTRHVLLTFDDGGRSAMHAADALSRRGWRGHFFVITGRLGERTFLTAADVRELHAHGHVVGSHTHTHPDIIRELPPARIDQEWHKSLDRVAQIVGAPCVAGAVPGGHTSREVERSAERAGLRFLFTCDPTTRARRVGDCMVLGRVLVRRTTSPAAIDALASFHGWTRAFLTRRGKDAVRHALPALFRVYVRRMSREVATS